MAQIGTAEEARRIVNYWADEGVTWFKAYTDISREALGAAIDQAHKRGLKFTGHLCSVSFREAVELHIDTLEHGFFTNSDYVTNRQPDHCSPEMRTSLLNVEDGRPGSAADDSGDGLQPRRDELDARRLRAVAPGSAAARGSRARGARAGDAR